MGIDLPTEEINQAKMKNVVIIAVIITVIGIIAYFAYFKNMKNSRIGNTEWIRGEEVVLDRQRLREEERRNRAIAKIEREQKEARWETYRQEQIKQTPEGSLWDTGNMDNYSTKRKFKKYMDEQHGGLL